MPENSFARLSLVVITRLIFGLSLIIPFVWVNHTLGLYPALNITLVVAVLMASGGLRVWRSLPRLPARAWQIVAFLLLALVPFATNSAVVQDVTAFVIFYVGTVQVLFGVAIIYEQPDAATKLGLLIGGLLFGLIVINIAAGMMLTGLEAESAPDAPTPEANAAEVAAEPTTHPDAATDVPTPTDAPSPTPVEATATDTPAPTAIPATDEAQAASADARDEQDDAPPPQPIPGNGYVDYLVDNGEVEWGHITGFGPRVNSIAHAYMVDFEGQLVYDTIVEYNAKGYRGPEFSYEKPDDVYRILIIGDSFVEALQVDYEETFYALLQNQLDEHATPDRRYEVIAQGRTGWGTLQEYLYYQAEGYKYNADLVVLMFFINDVPDNYPAFFYPDINNTNYEYIFDGDDVRIVDTNLQPLPPNRMRLLYNALPDVLQRRSLPRLLIRLFDPPTSIRTPGGILDRVHPQFYIYVTEPEVEGYDEAWRRTERGLTLFANAVAQNGGQFIVVPIFLGSEMVENVSHWWPQLVAGWQWDDGLPERRLSAILDDLPAQLVPTRPIFENYAREVGGDVYNLIYLPEDGHFNTIGHERTRDVLYNWLVEQGIVDE